MTEVVPYDEAWPDLAATAMAQVRLALTGVVTAVEHIGSTAVPGLPAKPVLDLMAAAISLDAVRRRSPALTGLGLDLHDNGMTDRLVYVRREGAVRTHLLHVVEASTWETRNQRLLRDHLIANPDARDAYAAAKAELARRGLVGRAYTEAKTPVVQALTDAARAARGLPPVDVWEKGG